jgi:hypothetical protein
VTDRTARPILFIALLALAIALAYPLLADFLRVSAKSDTQLIASFLGQAPEDVFGFGFWFAWIPLALFETFFLVSAAVLATARWRRYVVLGATLNFLAVSLLAYSAYGREWRLFFGR